MRIKTLALVIGILILPHLSAAEVNIPLKAKVASQDRLKISYALPRNVHRAVGVIKGRNITSRVTLKVSHKKLSTAVVPFTSLKSRGNYTFQVLGYKGKKRVARSAIITFKLSKTITPRAENLTLHGVNSNPIVATLSLDKSAVCEVTSDQVALSKISGCTFSFEPKNLAAKSYTASYQLYDTVTKKKSSPASIVLIWEQSNSFGGNYQSLGHYRSVLTDSEARTLARWAGLGKRQDEIAAVATSPNLGLDAAVDMLLSPGNSSICNQVRAEAIELSRSERTRVCRNIRIDTNNVNYCTDDTPQGRVGWTVPALQRYWLHLMRYGCDSFRERIALMLHNHFAVNLLTAQGSSEDVEMLEHLDSLRGEPTVATSMTPNFESLVRRMHGDDTTMLTWLNNNANTYTTISNQNYARELMELFTLGMLDPIHKTPNYSEQSVQELTKALTGYQLTWVPHRDASGIQACCDLTKAGCTTSNQCRVVETLSSTFVPSRWNDILLPEKRYLFSEFSWGDYNIFKANGFIEAEDNVTPYLLYKHPGSSRYLATRLIATFATTEPTEEMVATIANVLVQDRYDLKRALKIILTSQSFYSEYSRTDCVAAPVESFMSVISALNLPLTARNGVDLIRVARDGFAQQGQSLLTPDTVFGWQECGKITGNRIHKGLTWVAGNRGIARDKLMVVYLSELDKLKSAIGFKWSNLVSSLPNKGRNVNEVIDYMAQRFAITLSSEERALLTEYFTTVSLRSTSVNGVMVPTPGYNRAVDITALDDTNFEKYLTLKIPGLIHIMWSLPKSQLR